MSSSVHKDKKQQQLHHRMKKREVNQEELASMCLCALAIPLYPSTTFAVHCSFPEHTRYKQRVAWGDHGNCKLHLLLGFLSLCNNPFGLLVVLGFIF
jgi:hypothetical protein